jgi:hypothetical protein
MRPNYSTVAAATALARADISPFVLFIPTHIHAENNRKERKEREDKISTFALFARL